MPKTPAIQAGDIELDADANLWDVLRAASHAKEAHPDASLLPAMAILKSHEVVATVYQSSEEPRTLFVRSRAGMRKISLNWCDAFSMLYRTTLLTLQQLEGTTVVFLGERACEDAGRAMICAMKWTARQFLQQPARGSVFPETRDSISQPFYLEDTKICWLSEVTTSLQFS